MRTRLLRAPRLARAPAPADDRSIVTTDPAAEDSIGALRVAAGMKGGRG